MIAHSANVVSQSFCLLTLCVFARCDAPAPRVQPGLTQPAIDDSVADIDNLAEQRFIKHQAAAAAMGPFYLCHEAGA